MFPKKYAFLLAAALMYVLVTVFFFPGFYASIDEHEYAKNALLLSNGNLFSEDPAFACRSHEVNDRFVSRMFLGRSIFLVPFTFFGFSAMMLSGLMLHLINFLLVILILRKLNFNRLYSLIYLFFPTLFWESRTLNAELMVLSFFLLGAYFYISSENKKHWLISGTFFGLALLVRLDAIVGVLSFLFASLLKRQKRFVYVLLSFVPVLLLVIVNNLLLYGAFFSTGQGSVYSLGLGIFSNLGGFFTNIFVYFFILLLAIPLLVISPYLLKNRFPLKLEFALLTLAYLIFNARFTDFFAFPFSVSTLFTARLRYLVPLLGLLVIPYAGLLETAIRSLNERISLLKPRPMVLPALLFLLLFAGFVYATVQHDNFLNGRETVFQQIHEVVPENSIVIGSSDDCVYFIPLLSGDKGYLNVNPASDLGANYVDVPVESLIPDNKQVYILDVQYSNVAQHVSTRKDVIEAERDGIKAFIKKNSSNIDLVFETTQPHSLKIYKLRNA